MLIGSTYKYTANSVMRIDGLWSDYSVTLNFNCNGEETVKNYKTYVDEKGRYFKYCTRKVYNKFGKVIKYIYEHIYLVWFK